MKYAVSATGNTTDAAMDPRFGRAAWFVIVDSETGAAVSVIDNRSAANAAHGAGINAAAKVAEAGVDAVITGRVGPKAYAVLEQAGIKIITDSQGGNVAEVVMAHAGANSAAISAPTSDGHIQNASTGRMRNGQCRRNASRGDGSCRRGQGQGANIRGKMNCRNMAGRGRRWT